MKPSDELFRLIKSLSKAEKRGFKLYAARYTGSKTYLKLFEAIDKQKEYNEDKLLKLFAKEKFSRQLHRYKNYLTSLILQSLEMQYAADSVDSILKHKVLQIGILYKKGLFEQCRKLISNAKELAQKRESYLILLELSHWEFRLTAIQSYLNVGENYIVNLFNTEFNTIEEYKNYREYSEIEGRVFNIFKKEGLMRNPDYLKQLNKLASHPLLSDERSATSFISKIKFHSIHVAICSITHNFKKIILHTKRVVELIEENPYHIGDNKSNYIICLANHFNSQVSLNRFSEALQTVKKIKSVPVIAQGDKEMATLMTIDKELFLHYKMGDFEKGKALLNSIDREYFEGIVIKYKRESEVFFKIANIYFGMGEFQKASIYSKRIINTIFTNQRKDIECFFRIFLLIIYYEMGEQDQLEFSIRSVYRFLLKRDRLYKFEDAILTFIRKKIIKLNTHEELRKAFIELKDQLEKITKYPFEKTALDYFDFISWLESKIERRPFALVVKEKAKVG
ncbi:MAG: hypothetical protein HYU69_00715 [Bacteroidetes bacterium]|nr:hypothetical protein [Bacteroidota bacterium]